MTQFNKLFVDCGFHLGEGLNEFINVLKITNEWKVCIFEANPACDIIHKIPTNLNVEPIHKAVWIHNDGVVFNQENNKASNSPTRGSTSHLDGWGSCISDLHSIHTYENQVRVESVDFATWIQQFEGCEIYCKMDIEGAEFPVLRKLIELKSISLIKEIWVEWHDIDLPNESQISRNDLIREVSKYCKINSWK